MNQDIPLALSYDDVLLVPQYSTIDSRSDVNLTTKLTPNVTLKLPLISANMSDVTGIEMAVTLGKLGALGVLPRFMSSEEEADMVYKAKKKGVLVGAAIGCKEGNVQRAEMLLSAGADLIVLDVAHGHLKKVIDFTRLLKKTFGGKINLVAGNIATKEGADALFAAGADCIKVGVGPGSICTTRIETGSGVPQITVIFEAAKSAKRYKRTIIADGGTKSAGDIVKGLAAGASAIMAGSQFAGTDEAPGKLVTIGGKKFKSYNASTSNAEKNNHLKIKGNGLSKHYTKQIEGVESIVAYKGAVSHLVEKLTHGIKSGLSYSGARNLVELRRKAKFIRITNAGLRESLPHDVLVTQNS